MGDKIMHTHQYGAYRDFERNSDGRMSGINPTLTQVANDGKNQINDAKEKGFDVHKVSFEMSDESAEKTINFQKSRPGKNLGLYSIKTRSCLTHVMGVLSTGDVDVPCSAMRQYFYSEKMKSAKCKK